MPWLTPSLRVSELEKAIVNISAVIEIIENKAIDAIGALQEETIKNSITKSYGSRFIISLIRRGMHSDQC